MRPAKPPFPFFGALSLAMGGMAGLALIAFVVAAMRPPGPGAGALWSVFGPLVLGIASAAVGIRQHEQPERLSIIGLLANLAVPVLFILLGILMGAALGSWHD